MARTLLIMCMAAASLAAKDRAWQNGVLLDKVYNPYFKTNQVSDTSGVKTTSNSAFVAGDNGVMAVDTRSSSGDVNYDDYIVQGTDMVFLVEYARFKGFPPPNLSVLKPFTFAVEKNRVYIKDLDGHEFETSILKQTERRAPNALASAAPVETPKAEKPKPAPAPAKVEQAKVEQPRVEQSKVEATKPADKNDDLFARAPQATDDTKSKQAAAVPAKPVAVQKPAQPQPVVAKTESKPAPRAEAPAAKPEPKPEPKLEASVTKPASKPEPVTRPEVKPAPKAEVKPEPKTEAAVAKPAPKPEAARPEGPVVRASTKDRAWQAGQLLSVANNNYFFNVTYTSDVEGSTWPFSQGSDGRLTVTGQIAANTNSQYTYDNYVVSSEFVAYLVQRMRPKTSPAVRLPGTKALKFAVDKGKMWVIDEQGVEYEFKVVRLIQKDAIVDPLTRASAR